jgi:hypothetical protein
LLLALPGADVISVSILYAFAWPDCPSQALSWATLDVAEFVPWISGLALFSSSSVRPWLKAGVAVVSVPYSILAFAAGDLFVGYILGNCP